MRRHTAIALTTLLVHPMAHAGYFDCNVIYDEYESLMANQFLVAPERYVATKPDRITRTEFERLQKGTFLLYPERAGRGIGVFRSNANLHGKFLLDWPQPLPEQPPHVLIEQSIVYGRVADGHAPVRFAPIRLKPDSAVDLDTGRSMSINRPATLETDQAVQQADLVYVREEQTDEYVLQAVNGAALHFPLESLCHRPRGNTGIPQRN